MTKAYKLLFVTTIIMSTLISISSNSWLGMWVGLEINLLSIIPLMHSQKNLLSNESSIKYFIVQAIASTAILFSVILMSAKFNVLMSFNFTSPLILIMNSSLLTKMGMAPFHFWFPEVMEGLDWLNCLLILTWQKIAPMVLLMYNMSYPVFFSMIIIISMIISGILGINQISLRKILAYSSINHMGWMISAMMVTETVWFYYFLIYSFMTANLTLMFKAWKMFYVSQLYQSMNSDSMTKMFFIFNFFSLSGIPPFLGFLPKWLTVQALVQNKFYFMPTVMIIMTLVTIFMYIRIALTTFLMSTNEQNWNINLINKSFNSFVLSILNFFSLTSLILVTLMFNVL